MARLAVALALLLLAPASFAGDKDEAPPKKKEPAEKEPPKERKPGEEAGGMGALLKSLLASFETFDASGDGRISEDELPLGDLFQKLDADDDGYLLRDEIRKVVEGRGGKGMEDEGAADESFPDKARRIIARDPRFNAASRREEILRNFDRDPKDGKVARKEYPGQDGDRVFRKFDRDRNGELDEGDLLALAKEQITDLAKSRRHPDRNNFTYLFDLDNDRRVTREEYSILRGPASSWTAWDVDQDGVISDDEIRYPERYRGMDRNGREAAGPAAENKDVWDLYDADKDGRVAPGEFKGGEAVFRRLDRDHDGYLTVADK